MEKATKREILSKVNNFDTLRTLYKQNRKTLNQIIEETNNQNKKTQIQQDIEIYEQNGIIESEDTQYKLSNKGKQLTEELFHKKELLFNEGIKSRGLNIDNNREYRKGFVWTDNELYSVTIEQLEKGEIQVSYLPAEQHTNIPSTEGSTETITGELPENDQQLTKIVQEALN